MEKIRNHPFLMLGTLFFLGMAAIFLFINPVAILNFIYVMIGVGLIISGASKIILANQMNNNSFPLEGLLNIGIGVAIIFFNHFIVTIILGALFMVFPIIRICKAYNKKYAFKKELPLLIIGLVIALSGDFVFWILIKVVGGFFLLVALYLFVLIFTDKFSLTKIKQEKTNKKSDDYINATYEERD